MIARDDKIYPIQDFTTTDTGVHIPDVFGYFAEVLPTKREFSDLRNADFEISKEFLTSVSILYKGLFQSHCTWPNDKIDELRVVIEKGLERYLINSKDKYFDVNLHSYLLQSMCVNPYSSISEGKASTLNHDLKTLYRLYLAILH